uniref:Uncharacterized protein n=1 Tax=Panagrolaimus sp. JU765 TaxID=591449 RepID=A0AC34QT56_9BILA
MSESNENNHAESEFADVEVTAMPNLAPLRDIQERICYPPPETEPEIVPVSTVAEIRGISGLTSRPLRASSVPLNSLSDENRLQNVNRTNSIEQQSSLNASGDAIYEANSDNEIDVVTVDEASIREMARAQPLSQVDLTCPETFDRSKIRMGLENEYDSDDSIENGPPPPKLTRNEQVEDSSSTENNNNNNDEPEEAKPEDSPTVPETTSVTAVRETTPVANVEDVEKAESIHSNLDEEDARAVSEPFGDEVDLNGNGDAAHED